jgi:uncharacterized protein YutE (UPF0331/DUF86 family)
MVDREIFSRRLDALHGYLARLRAFRDVDEAEFLREAALHDLAARYLHLAVEACLDLANHWIADRSLPTPDANRDTFTILEHAGEIAPELAERLRGWAGFRNILVHEYLEIDHAIAYRAIREELDDLEAVAVWAAGKLDVGASELAGGS